MVSWINFAVLIVSSLLILYYYVKSVKPAALEKKIGEIAYKKCALYRKVASVFMFVVAVNYLIYFFYPLSILADILRKGATLIIVAEKD